MDEKLQINKLIEKGKEVLKTVRYKDYAEIADQGQFDGWKSSCLTFIKKLDQESPHYKLFQERVHDIYKSCVESGIHILYSISEDIESGVIEIQTSSIRKPFENIELIIEKFDRVTKALRHRHDNRPTLDIADEYDVQDLLHSLLKLYFDDVRPEEWCPSYAGKSSRMDFLLKSEEIVIEAKMTRANLKDKEIGSQLIEDIARYKEHPNCKTLICFVYDPQSYIKNPKGVENDLNKSKELNVRVFIRPS
ncbi:MAG: hypothetical protein K1X86_00730 [Ignavibacteria bacterium]|nr:hypothetical protein [Ignavibacteria bacterium]